jgi:DNA mismatch repair protein MutS
MDYIKEITVKDYFEIHNYYANKYGKDRTIILMQVGSFHEAYCKENEGLDLVTISQQLDIHLAKKMDCTRMMGFPIHVTNNYIDRLIDMNYTVVVIDQVTEPPNPKRKVTAIYSPATRIEKKTNNNNCNLVSIVLDYIKDIKTNQYNMCIGLAAYDMSTGMGAVYETYSNTSDSMLALDDALRFLETYPPREIVLNNMIPNNLPGDHLKIEDIMTYLSIDISKTYNISESQASQSKKLSWQKNILNNIYKLETNVDIMEYIGIEFLNWARQSLVILLDYVMAHQPILLKELHIPTLFSSSTYLYLGNRALEQLDVNSMFNIINHTKTAVGKRMLRCQLTMPIIDTNEINRRYDMIGTIISGDHSKKMVNYLEDIYDIDKLVRKLEINVINPAELYQLYLSFYQINRMNSYMKENKLTKAFSISSDNIKKVNEFITMIEERFNLEKINSLSFANFTETDFSFYNKSIHKELDIIQESIDVAQNFMSYLIKALEQFIDDKVYFKKPKQDVNNEKGDDESKSLITLKFNERDGHYLMITQRRCEIMRKNMEKIKTLKVGNFDLDVNDLSFSDLPKSSNTKITCDKIKKISEDLVSYKISLAKKLKDLFKQDMNEMLESYGSFLHNWSNKIAFIDFINSGAICALTNNYSKPTIEVKSASFFKAKEMRHPIIERIATDFAYVPHNIELGFETEQNGILLYGINSSGKSTLMKAIGLNIILAQIGYYTATSNFTYSPYSSLFTRICGNDNMFKGLSSFMVEMMELMAILKRNNNKTLVLGDELAKGTEFRSGIVIVSYMLETLARSGSSFITATHLHDICKMESIAKLEGVKTKHLKITYDAKNDMLIYDRHLLDGQGETFYGLQVAKYLMKDKLFNERTNILLNEYDAINGNGRDNTIRTSKYNSDIIMNCCEICKSTNKLESHHIVWQKDFKNNTNAFHLQKNDSSNLVTLCMKCHDMVDRNEIIVKGWIDTSSGRIFDYTRIEPGQVEKKSKYNEEMIQYIKSLKNITKNDMNKARIEIKEKYNKKVSTKTISNFWI